jgi:hypothetical protein
MSKEKINKLAKFLKAHIFNDCEISYLQSVDWNEFALGIEFKSKEIAEKEMSKLTRIIEYINNEDLYTRQIQIVKAKEAKNKADGKQ